MDLKFSNLLKAKYPNKIPIIIYSKEIELRKKKYLIEAQHTLGQLMYNVRKQMINVDENEALFLFTKNNKLLTLNSMICLIPLEEYDENGFLVFTLTKENTFGINA